MEAKPDAVLPYLTGSPGENFLAAAGHRDQPALSGALCLEIEPGRLPAELADEIVFQGCLSHICLIERRFKSRCFMGHKHAQMGRGGKGIALYVVDGELKAWKTVDPRKGFVGRIASPVNGEKEGSELLRTL